MDKLIKFLDKHTGKLLIVILIAGSFLRFYNLNWGAPYYFHPDERNIASSVLRLQFPVNMNPYFFAYGSLPIMLIYFAGVLKNILFYYSSLLIKNILGNSADLNISVIKLWEQLNIVSFNDAIIVSRSFSALFSVIIIYLLYRIGSEIHSKSAGLLAAFFGSLSVGFIQFAHFGTFELWITIFCTILFYLCIRLIDKPTIKNIILTGITSGILIATKISNLVLLAIPVLTVCLVYSHRFNNLRKPVLLQNTISFFMKTIILLISALSVFLLTNPYTILDNKSFSDTIRYETNVALGTLPVFYTQEFITTVPVLYQFLHIYPFLLNPIITSLLIPSFLYLLFSVYRTKNKKHTLLLIFFVLLFLSQSFLFVKWIRYMVPTLPFIYLIIAITIADFYKNIQIRDIAKHIVLAIIITSCILYSFSYYFEVLSKPDSRVSASLWAKHHISKGSKILSEVYDVGITPFYANSYNITFCDTYNLETNAFICDGQTLKQTIEDNSFIILASERVLQSRLSNKIQFPAGHDFYTSLVDEKLNYSLIYKTPCNLFCKILYTGEPLWSLEQTANVFDRPTVYIFQKQH